MKSDSEVLGDAITIIEAEKGWCKGDFFRDENGNGLSEINATKATTYCLEGALQVATGHTLDVILGNDTTQSEGQFDRVRQRLLKLLREGEGGLDRGVIWASIPGFNDAEQTTKEDAILLLKYGKAQAESEESGSASYSSGT